MVFQRPYLTSQITNHISHTTNHISHSIEYISHFTYHEMNMFTGETITAEDYRDALEEKLKEAYARGAWRLRRAPEARYVDVQLDIPNSFPQVWRNWLARNHPIYLEGHRMATFYPGDAVDLRVSVAKSAIHRRSEM